MLPLESLEVGVPCITGNNHHYFKNDELEKFLVVNQESNPIDIKNKIEAAFDWESARYTKPDKPLDAFDTWKKYYPNVDMYLVYETERICKQYNNPYLVQELWDNNLIDVNTYELLIGRVGGWEFNDMETQNG